MRTVIIDMKRPKSVKRVLLASFYGMSHKKLKRKYGARAVKKAIIFRRAWAENSGSGCIPLEDLL